jgi:hypothetical protein
MPDLDDDDRQKRLETLESFVSDVAHRAGTLRILAGHWGGDEGAALGGQAAQMRERIDALGMNETRN